MNPEQKEKRCLSLRLKHRIHELSELIENREEKKYDRILEWKIERLRNEINILLEKQRELDER